MMEKVLHNKDIGSRIMGLRKKKGYSREQLSEMAGISAKFLYDIEIKKVGFSADTLKGLSHGLEVSTDYILFGRSGFSYEEEIADTLGKFEPCSLEKVRQLLQIAYEMAHNR